MQDIVAMKARVVTPHIPDPETYQVIGAAMAVHRELGCGFLENVYAAALPIELEQRGIPFESEVTFPVHYKGAKLPVCYRVDFICMRDIVVEIKALNAISDREVAQIINYLKAAKIRRRLLLNFGAVSLQHRRFVYG